MADEVTTSSPTELQPRPRSRRQPRDTETERAEDTSAPQQEVAGNASSSAQATMERKKPRKLERRSAAQTEEPVHQPATPSPSPSRTLNTRVEFLEQQMHALDARVDRVEIRSSQQSSRRAPYRRAPSSSTARASTSSHQAQRTARAAAAHHQQRPIPSLADQLRETQSRRRRPAAANRADSAVEEVPRTNSGLSRYERQVALTGQYAIPLPANLSSQDVRDLRSGVAAAGSVVRAVANALSSSGANAPAVVPADLSQDTGTPAAAAAEHRQSGEAGVQSGRGWTGMRGDAAAGIDSSFAASGDGTSYPGKLSGSGPAGNQPPDMYTTGPIAEGAKNWKGFLNNLGTVVASAAKDAAVEVRDVNVKNATPSRPSSSGKGRSGRPGMNSRTSSRTSSRR